MVVRQPHKDFLHYFGNGVPGVQEFYLNDGLTRYRAVGTLLRLSKPITIGTVKCKVIEVQEGDESRTITQYYIAPDGSIRGYFRKWRQADQDCETEERYLNVKVSR
jgi:hypothetical protein